MYLNGFVHLRRVLPAAAILCGVTLAGGAGAALAGPPVAAATGKAAKPVYCTRHRRPKGCVKVPKAAKRPSRIDQQGPDSLTPPDVKNGGGLGGGPGNHRDTAVQWARSQARLKRWRWRCERFVEEAFGTRGRFDTAKQAADTLELHRGAFSEAPRGSLVYFGADRHNRGYGHVGLALGRGRMLSALQTVTTTDVSRSPYWQGLYLGWADAPEDWPGRIPPAPGPTTEPQAAVRITAPAFGQTVSGSVGLAAKLTEAPGGVVFDAYYAADPADAKTRRWTTLGKAQERDGAWVLEWDTSRVPDQGDGTWGTVNVAATALDENGRRTGTRDYRRIAVDNSTGSRPVAAAAPVLPAPAPAPEPTVTTSTAPQPPPGPDMSGPTFAETTGGAANTWSDYKTATGESGRQLLAYETVQVSCRLEGYQVPDGNTWWYRLASSPWDYRFYATADAFYNNGATSGSLAQTPFVDEAIPLC